MLAVDDVGLAQCLLRGRAALPAEAVLPRRRVQAGLPIERLLARARAPVDGAGVVVQRVDPRPVDVDGVLVGLPDGAAVAGARERDAAEVGFADLGRRGGEDRHRVHVARREALGQRVDSGKEYEQGGNRQRTRHAALPVWCPGSVAQTGRGRLPECRWGQPPAEAGSGAASRAATRSRCARSPSSSTVTRSITWPQRASDLG